MEINMRVNGKMIRKMDTVFIFTNHYVRFMRDNERMVRNVDKVFNLITNF